MYVALVKKLPARVNSKPPIYNLSLEMHLSYLFMLLKKILYNYKTTIIILLVPEDVIEDSNFKDKSKTTALLREYREIRSEIRAVITVEMTFLALSILIFAIMFITSTLSNQYILLFISPLLSILFLIIGMSMFAYQTNLSLKFSS